MELIPGIQSTSDALRAEKQRLSLIAQNIANANTTKDVDGKPYTRKIALFESYMVNDKNGTESVRVKEVQADKTPGAKVYIPGHPHADKEGMVEMPNVNTAIEMVDLISASRAYEANLSVIKTARQMAQQAITIGR